MQWLVQKDNTDRKIYQYNCNLGQDLQVLLLLYKHKNHLSTCILFQTAFLNKFEKKALIQELSTDPVSETEY